MKEASLSRLLDAFITNAQGDQYVAIPGVVVRVYDELRALKVDVQPSVNNLYEDMTTEEHPILLNIPVIMPGTVRSLVSFPIAPGDTVLVVFCHRSIDNFKAGSGMPTRPSDRRVMSMLDGVAIPGLFPFAKSPNNPAIRSFPHSTSDVVVSHNLNSTTECEVRLKLDGNIVLNTNQNVIVNAESAQVNASSVQLTADTLEVTAASTTWNGNATITGTWTFNGIPFNTHRHTGVQTGGGTSAGPVA